MEKREHGADSQPAAAKKARSEETPSPSAPIPAAAQALAPRKEKKTEEKDAKPAHPFGDLKLASHEHLKALDGSGRSECSRCHLKRKYFCYTCLLPMGDPALTPRIILPIHCDIESLSKSTAVHAKILAPDSVSNAKPIEDIDMTKIKHVVFIDSQWQQAKKILRDPLVQSLPCVKIESQRTHFWRYQQLGDEALATIEAIYYFYREYQTKVARKYEGQFDNLLFFYTFMYDLIQDRYKKDNTITFTHKKGYIKYDK